MIDSSVTVKTGKRKARLWTVSDTKACVELVEDIIKARIRRGVNVDGTPFAPYTDAYAKRTGKLRVTLRDTGVMLKSMGIVIDKEAGSVTVKPTYSVYVDGKRSFMGLTEAEADRILKLVDKLVDKHTTQIDNGGRVKTYG